MRIVVNDIAASSGGALSILKDFYAYVKSQDKHNEWIFLLGDKYLDETDNIKVITLPHVKKSGVRKLIFDIIGGKSFIDRLRPDVVFSLQNIITFGVKVPQIVYIHQSIPFQTVKNFSFLKKSERIPAVYQHIIGKFIILSAKKANKVIVQTKWMKSAVIQKAIITPDKIINVLPNVECLGANLCVSDAEFDSKRFFYPTSQIVYKNNDCIYRAAQLLEYRGINGLEIRLTISKLENVPHNYLRFLGRITREEVLREYKLGTLIFPSYIETFGYPLAEARKLGSIILASDCPFSREVLDGYENAYFFDPFNPNELAMLMDQVARGSIVRKSTIQLREESNVNSWEQVVDELLHIKI